MMDRESMKRLMRIAAHPVYGLAIRRIDFNTAVLVNEEKYEDGREVVEIGSDDEDHADDGSDSEEEADEEVDEEDDDGASETDNAMVYQDTPLDIAHRRAVFRDHVEFRNHVQGCVAAVLKSLDQSGGPVPEIRTIVGCLWPTDSAFKGPWGIKRLIRDVGRRYLTTGVHEHRSYRPYDMLCGAIGESDCALKTLSLGHHYRYFDPWTLKSLILQEPVRAPFKHLRHLNLYLEELKVASWLEGEARERAQSDVNAKRCCVLWLVSQATQLESLSLDSKSFYLQETDILNEKSRACDAVVFRSLVMDKHALFPKALQHIKELSLHGHEVPKQMLLDFIRDHGSTLRSLKLWEITDQSRVDPDIKDHIFAAARDIEGFRLKIGRVYEGTRTSSHSNDYGRSLEWEIASSTPVQL